LAAECETRDGCRNFRVDRVVEADRTERDSATDA
jgi:predicted DNA-binding transcriptional regulator YafY